MVIFTCVFVFVTLALSGSATLFLTLSLLSNEWEYLGYQEGKVQEIAKEKGHTFEWLPEHLGKLEMIVPVHENVGLTNQTKIPKKIIIVYLIPAYGGVHKLCVDLTGNFNFFFLNIYF